MPESFNTLELPQSRAERYTAVAEEIASQLSSKGPAVQVLHRDLGRE